MQRRNLAAWALTSTLWACASSEPVAPSAPTPPVVAISQGTPAATALPPSASQVDFDLMARFPEPGWGIPRQAAFSPSGRQLSFLASETGSEQMVLWTMPVDAGEPRVLLRASDLVAPGAGRSLAEELRDERQRKRITGITEAYWASEADALVVPAGGDVYVLPSVGEAPVRITSTEQPELDPKLSPDGTMVAYVRGAELYVADVATRRERALTRAAPEGVTRGQSDFNGQEEFDEPSGYWWSTDGRRIAYLEVDERDVGTVPLLGYRGGATLSTPLRYPRAGTANPRVELRIVEVATGKSLGVPLPESLGEGPYLGRLRWLPGGERLALQALTRDQKRRDTLLFDLATPKRRARVVHREANASAWVELSELRPLPDGTGLLTILSREGHEHLAVLGLEADLESSRAPAPRMLTEGDWEVFELLELDRDEKRVWVVANRDERLGRQVLELDLASGATRAVTTLPRRACRPGLGPREGDARRAQRARPQPTRRARAPRRQQPSRSARRRRAGRDRGPRPAHPDPARDRSRRRAPSRGAPSTEAARARREAPTRARDLRRARRADREEPVVAPPLLAAPGRQGLLRPAGRQPRQLGARPGFRHADRRPSG
jgi:dipeptidyl-peptidase 4